jgi:hypothetical protein
MPDTNPLTASYLALMERILAAQTEADLLILLPELPREAGLPREDFAETWATQWAYVSGGKPIPGLS